MRSDQSFCRVTTPAYDLRPDRMMLQQQQKINVANPGLFFNPRSFHIAMSKYVINCMIPVTI